MKNLRFRNEETDNKETTAQMANILLSSSEGNATVMLKLITAINDLRALPDEFLDQLRENIKQNQLKAPDWKSKEGMRIALDMLNVVVEVRKVMKLMITKFVEFEDEEDEKQYRKNNPGFV